MRLHCSGLGSIGSLFAFHLRLSNPKSKYPISLLFSKNGFKQQLREEKSPQICVETSGVRRKIDGFDLEMVDKTSQRIFSLPLGPKQLQGVPRLRTQQLPFLLPPRPEESIKSLIITNKAGSTKIIIDKLRDRINAATTIFLLQNGMGVYDHLVADTFKDPDTRPSFIIGTTTHGVWAKGQLDVVHAGMGTLQFGIVPDPLGRRDFEALKGPPPGIGETVVLDADNISTAATQEDDPKFYSLAETTRALLRITHLQPQWVPIAQLQPLLRRKLVVNACIGPLTAMLGCRNGALYGNNAAHKTIRQVCREAAAVLAAQSLAEAEAGATKIGEPAPPTARELEAEVLRVIRATSLNQSSMLVDVRKGNTTEIEYINGYLSRLGEMYGVETPTNDTLLEMIKMKEIVPPFKEDYRRKLNPI